MQPNQPTGQSPQQNPYDFITNPGQPPKRTFLGGGGDNFMKRILVIVGGAVVLMIIMAIVVSILGSGGGGATKSMQDLVLQQQQIILLSNDGAKSAIDPSIRGFAITAALSVQTDQSATTNYLDSISAGVNKKIIPLTLETETSTALETAKSTNRYDETFEQLLRSRLTEYQAKLQTTYKATSSESAKQILNDAFTNSSTLLSDSVSANN